MKGKKVVVITGCSAGLGRAIALEFARNGFDCGLISRNKDRLDTLKKEIEDFGVKAYVAPCDVAFFDQLEKSANHIEKALGDIDIWINNAMVSIFSPFQEISAEEFKRVTEVTYLGTVYGTQIALKKMKKKDQGVIIQVGSALAYRGIPLQAPYCGAKHAVKGFTDSLQSELLHDKSGIKITMVQLPAMNTPQFSWVKSRLKRKAQPVPPIFQPEVAARAVFWAAFHHRREWIVGFSAQKAITANKFIPSFIDRFLAKKGYESQQYDGLEKPHRKDNLFTTVDGPFGAHGSFDKRAHAKSFQFWFSKNRWGILLTSTLVIIAIVTSFLVW